MRGITRFAIKSYAPDCISNPNIDQRSNTLIDRKGEHQTCRGLHAIELTPLKELCNMKVGALQHVGTGREIRVDLKVYRTVRRD